MQRLDQLELRFESEGAAIGECIGTGAIEKAHLVWVEASFLFDLHLRNALLEFALVGTYLRDRPSDDALSVDEMPRVLDVAR